MRLSLICAGMCSHELRVGVKGKNEIITQSTTVCSRNQMQNSVSEISPAARAR
jgi:hypothetical protein